MSTSIRICSYLLLPLIYLLVNVKIAQLGESFPITIVTFLPVLLLLFLERISIKKLTCYGRTVCDELGVLGKPANTKVGITIDTDWFWGLVEECVRGYIKTH